MPKINLSRLQRSDPEEAGDQTEEIDVEEETKAKVRVEVEGVVPDTPPILPIVAVTAISVMVTLLGTAWPRPHVHGPTK